MPVDVRYVRNEASYLPVAEIALASQFQSPENFLSFYKAIATPTRRNEFLRAALFYYHMVKTGDWVVTADDSNPIIDYFTNSYKVVGLFAVIESLSAEIYHDFHSWLLTQPNSMFPVTIAEALNLLHDRYKLTYGSIRRCVAFFGRLSQGRQSELCSAVEINNQPVKNIKKLAEFLYNTRSKFVHEAQVVLQVSGSTYHFGQKKNVHTKLTIPVLCAAFEEGLVAYFRET